MELGMIGLGRMGSNMTQRLLDGDYRITGIPEKTANRGLNWRKEGRRGVTFLSRSSLL